MSSVHHSGLSSNGGLSIVPSSPIPISHPPSRRFSSNNSPNSSRQTIVTLHDSTTTPINASNQFRLGNTVVHTLSCSSHNSVVSPYTSRSSLMDRRLTQQQVQLPPQRCTTLSYIGSEARRENYGGRDTHINTHNCGNFRRRRNIHSLICNESNETSLSINGSSNSVLINPANSTGLLCEDERVPQAEEHMDIMIECERCKLPIPHSLFDDHMLAHELEIGSDSTESNTSSDTSRTTSTMFSTSSSFHNGNQVIQNFPNGVFEGANEARTSLIRTEVSNENDLEVLTETRWRGLARRRNALWPFVRVSTGVGLSNVENRTVIGGDSLNDVTSALERIVTSFSSNDDGGETMHTTNSEVIVRTSDLNNDVNISTNSSDSIGTTNGNSYVHSNPNVVYGYSPLSLSSSRSSSIYNEEYNVPLSTYRATYNASYTSRHSRNLNVSSGIPVLHPRRAYSMNQHGSLSHSNFVYPIRSSRTTISLNDEAVENNSPLPPLCISLLPTSVFDASRSSSLREISRTCAICLEEYITGDNQKRLPCTHVYHQSCIDAWLRKSRLCPVCKYNVTP